STRVDQSRTPRRPRAERRRDCRTSSSPRRPAGVVGAAWGGRGRTHPVRSAHTTTPFISPALPISPPTPPPSPTPTPHPLRHPPCQAALGSCSHPSNSFDVVPSLRPLWSRGGPSNLLSRTPLAQDLARITTRWSEERARRNQRLADPGARG